MDKDALIRALKLTLREWYNKEIMKEMYPELVKETLDVLSITPKE